LLCFFDDESAALTPANTNAAMGTAVNRGREYYSFSLDHTFERTFVRSYPIEDYDWTPVGAGGSQTSTFGGLYVIGDGQNTANAVFGYFDYWYLIHLRMRQ